MGYQPFLIALPRIGLERDLEPAWLPNDAYPQLEDCYLWRGRIKRKQGYNLLGQLNYAIAVLGATPTSTTTFTIPGVSVSTPLLPFGTQFVWNGVTFTDNGIGGFTQTDGGVSSTINYTTGVVVLNLVTPTAGITTVFYFPGLPVMGLPSLNQPSVAQSEAPDILMAFDTKFSYYFSDATRTFTGVNFMNTSNTPFYWQGDDADFFWTTNYFKVLWATNFQPGWQSAPTGFTPANGDGIRFFFNDLSGWVNFLPPLSSTATITYLQGALIILPYKGRLVMFNTWEGSNTAIGTNFPQRARWSSVGTPFYVTPAPAGAGVNASAWFSGPNDVGKGGFFDAPTQEQIISAQFLKDTIIVYFEHSTWQFAFTGNELLPFQWVKINTELGALSTFSEIPFDKIVLGVGDVGIHACDIVNVDRIDQKIPDEVFAIQNSDFGRERVYGIRDYYTQLVYWALPYAGSDDNGALDDVRSILPPPGVDLVYPNRVLAYNYIDQSFSFFNDSFTCFGYYAQGDAVTWETVLTKWQETQFRWVSATELPAFPYVVAGNQQGFVEIFDPEIVSNDISLFIGLVQVGVPMPLQTQITVLNHNLFTGMIIRVTNNGVSSSFEIVSVIDANNFVISTPASNPFPNLPFTGDAYVTTIPDFNVLTKRFSPFIEEAMQNRLGFIDIYVDRTTDGEFQVLLYQDEDTSIPINEMTVATYAETTYTTNPDTLPFNNAKLWKRIYFQNVSQMFQLQLTLSNTELMTPNIASSDITIHGMILWFSKAGRLING